MTGPFVILDRDGVINFDSPDYIKSPEEWVPIPGSLEAIAMLTRAGFDVYIATNQAGVARGKFTVEDLDAIHTKMRDAVENHGGKIAGIEYCPHHPDDDCDCRKPSPGMLRAIAKSLGASLAGHPFVGDSAKDLGAAEAAGCVPVLVLTGSGAETRRQRPDTRYVYDDLLAFARDWIRRAPATRRDSQP
ncbi:MAG: D-glycero-beta-D-manno-heptose 1,7-bisphosphate 7-phosphatase [Pseudomonadales bacterium]|nr:D-glycero-beta-D-manno-heptose 1,7-bisphosphate 7-phosphatase [Pseudomonadales bacterium]